MDELKKDHSVGAGTGAVAGAGTGAIVGAALGPVGSAIGAILGGIAGAKAGDSIAEAVNPTDYDDYWRNAFKNAPYYREGMEWEDYAPAYGLGYHGRARLGNRRFDDVERDMERAWDSAKGRSRLAWTEAREAVRDGWHHVERAIPGDFDGDGR
ncbi:MAG: hypothetical protein HKN72_02585 [Gemmatimonadetes bacterium]|nr:hypothetical protein [Gemmatimonadota bacterium]